MNSNYCLSGIVRDFNIANRFHWVSVYDLRLNTNCIRYADSGNYIFKVLDYRNSYVQYPLMLNLNKDLAGSLILYNGGYVGAYIEYSLIGTYLNGSFCYCT